MKSYDKEVFEKLILFVRNEDKEAEKWLLENDCRELKEFGDACEGMEISFKWLIDNNFKQLAATVDALNGNDQAKVFLLCRLKIYVLLIRSLIGSIPHQCPQLFFH